MAIRYYPLSKIKADQNSNGQEYSLNGQPYTGKYYTTFDGKAFTGANPIVGSNQLLQKIPVPTKAFNSDVLNLPNDAKSRLENTTKSNIVSLTENQLKDQPTPYHLKLIEDDYKKGYIIRYFTKKVNSPGYVIEISPFEYAMIQNGTVPYDVSFWQILEIFWKLTGPLNRKVVSEYNIRAGIIDTNKRLIENANKTFLGIKEFIGEDYAKYSKPTE
jgi:hypothetical protein